MRKIFIPVLFLSFAVTACINVSTRNDAHGLEVIGKTRADLLLDKIGEGTANDSFLATYFPQQQTTQILGQLKDYCDFKNRKGKFVDFYYDINNPNFKGDVGVFIYEFALKCDNARILIGYKVNQDNLTLVSFSIESPKKPNPMITHLNARLFKDTN